MLKKMSLSAEDEGDETAGSNSESRMLRALEALSSQPQPPLDPALAPQPDATPFRPNKQPAAREPFRNDTPFYGAKARHRFVRDGEVPVVHMSVPRPASAGRGDADWAKLQQQLDEHKQRADTADRVRNEAQMQIKALQTKLAHAELALSEAVAQAQSRQDELQAVREELGRMRPPPPLPPAPHTAFAAAPLPGPDGMVVKRGPGRPRKIPLPVAAPGEPQPVEWWLIPAKGKRRG